MRNIKLIIEYDGTAYCGWQVQPNGVTVQAVLKRAIEKMVGHAVTLTGASRTDSGVHALGQVANFKTPKNIPCDGFLNGLNSLLPEDIAIKNVEEVPDDFHAKRSAKGKHYRYLIAFGRSRPVLMRNRAWYVGNVVAPFMGPKECPMNRATTHTIAKNINKAAQPLVGLHDFSAFCASGDHNRSKVREIYSIRANVIPSACLPARQASEGSRELKFSGSVVHHRRTQDDMTILAIDIKGGGFLKYMVRNIVGTICKLKKLKSDPNIYKILGSRDRTQAGVTAPACGLYLVEVFY